MVNKQLGKFLLLLWKNWTLLRRRPIHTAFEIILPVALCLVLVAIRGIIKIEQKEAISYYPTNPAVTVPCSSGNVFSPDYIIGYSPDSPLLAAFFDGICNNRVKKGYASSSDLNYAIDNQQDKFVFAVQFDDAWSGISNTNFTVPTNLGVTLRLLSNYAGTEKQEWYTNLLQPIFQSPGPRNPDNNDGGEPYYQARGFLALQEAIALALISQETNINNIPGIFTQRFPYPEWVDDPFYGNYMESMVALIIMISFMYNYINTIRSITTEKEKQLKESMKVMGLPGWLHWLAWFTRTFIMLAITCILIVVIIKVEIYNLPVFIRSDGTLLFVFLLLFACSTITFSFLISVFFSKANTAAAVGSLIFFLTYLPFTLQQQQSETLTLGSVLGSSLLANSGLSFGMALVLQFEAIEEGVQWDNMWTSVSPDTDVTFGAIMMMFVVDTFLYLIIAIYVEAIFPGDFGIPQPWYFPFTRSYWCDTVTKIDTDLEQNTKGEFFEDFTEELPTGIQMRNLSKTFGSNKAVKNLNLNMYEGHITVLLGHNGAGKTTTMSMITGMFPPSSGTAIVGGHDVRSDMQHVRDSMGLCLQHNVLFDNLTVWEHLYFFGKLKGLQSDEINDEIDRYIKLLELEDKRHVKSSALSGGMKRKLSVGMALCGKSKVVMLDEPTAGMDPSARRAIWDILQQQKQGRTILLTTHFMDEADLLGDRIAIMTSGILQCCGSSFFLKRKYGAGYYLIMDVTPECRSKSVTELLRKYIPYIEVYSHVGSELTYQLDESESKKFEVMLEDLEGNVGRLGVQSYGVSLTTLEEVFMKVGADHDKEKKQKATKDIKLSLNKTELEKVNKGYLTGWNLMLNQVIAMWLKKMLSTLRTWHLFLFQVILPVALLLITVLSGRGNRPLSTFPALRISLDPYNNPVTLISGTGVDFTTYRNMLNEYEVSEVDDISDRILTLTKDTPGIVKRRYIVGASFNDSVATAWFNGDPYHSPPLALSLVLNALYKGTFGADKSIHFINHPLPLSVEAQLDDLQFNAAGFQISIGLGYGMAFVASFYILFCIRERVSKSKHLQFVSGANVFVFWGTSFLYDLVTYLITVIFILITLAAMQEDGFATSDELGRITLVLIYFGFFFLPFMYLASYLFATPSTGFARMMLLGAITGIIGIVVIQVLEVRDLDLLYVAKPLHWVLLFIPFYSVAKGIYDLSNIYTLREVCTSNFHSLEEACISAEMCCGLESYYSMTTPGIGRNIIVSFLMCLFLFALLIMNEYGVFKFIRDKIINFSKGPIEVVSLDADVLAENTKIKNTPNAELTSSYRLVLRDVTKYYKNFLAVNGLCLGVKPYECFGLLGVNGAGKTTTFKMMTGDEQLSYGEAWVKGLNITKKQKQVQKLIGYCPQFDALLDDLTARETLRIFALIRGVPSNQCRSLGEALAEEFDFYKHLDKKVKELSGGNKRKLSTALALIGDPPIIYLDEPTTGMDPATKRYLWTALSKLRERGKSIILTSHSMEECEALCTRLAIMVNGNFQCLGSTQRLKSKFAQGYALTIKVRKIQDATKLEGEIAAIHAFINENFPGAELKEKHQELLSYQLAYNSLPWSKMFGILEKTKESLGIEDYSLGQCSLEQVFLSFTKYQQ